MLRHLRFAEQHRLFEKVINERWLVEHGASTTDLELSTNLPHHLLDLDDTAIMTALILLTPSV